MNSTVCSGQVLPQTSENNDTFLIFNDYFINTGTVLRVAEKVDVDRYKEYEQYGELSKKLFKDRRYDYLYSADELAGWVDRIASLAAGARDVFVIANNHYRGKGLANALELKAMIEGEKVEAPPDLLAEYPRLAERTRPARRCARPACAFSTRRRPT